MKYVIEHPLEASCTAESLQRQEAQLPADPEVRLYHTFVSLTQRRAIRLFEAPDRVRLIDYLDANDLPYDRIWTIELEMEAGRPVAPARPSW
ncbi:MAG: hypothetical protein ACOC95_01095 [Planctomycetota bacterium]